MNSLSPAKLLSRSLIGAVGLSVSAIALLGVPESAQAAADCGLSRGKLVQGADWVSRCPGGVDVFRESWVFADIWLLNPDGTMGQQFDSVMFKGPATIWRNPGANGVITTELNHILKGNIPGIGDIVLKGGDGTANGQNDGPGYSTGAIEDTDGDGLASSFFDVFVELDTPFGILNNTDPVTVTGDRWLTGVSPDVIIPPFPPVPPLPVPPPLIPGCNDPEEAIVYCGDTPVTFFDSEGIPRLIIHAEVHQVHPKVPEPSTAVPLALLGLAGLWGLQKKQLVK